MVFPLRSVWTLALNTPLSAAPAWDDTRGYFPLDGGRLVAYTLRTGTQIWIADIATTETPAAGGDRVFVAQAAALLALDAATGTLLWQLPFAETLGAPLVWGNGWLIAATASGRVLAFRADDGHLIWDVDLGAKANARPAFSGSTLYVPLADARVAALDVDTGQTRWEHKLGGAPHDILPLEDRLYVGAKDNFFYALDTKDGRIAWRWRTGADAIGLPAVDARAVYFVSLDNVLRALKRSSGVQLWMTPLPLRPMAGPLRALESLVVSGLTPTLRGFGTEDGKVAGDIATEGEIAAPPHLVDTPGTFGPSVAVVTRDLTRGAVVALYTRRIEPPVFPIAVLPNPVGGNPMPAPGAPPVPVVPPMPPGPFR